VQTERPEETGNCQKVLSIEAGLCPNDVGYISSMCEKRVLSPPHTEDAHRGHTSDVDGNLSPITCEKFS
jgi:hypothetical protein